MGALEVVTGQEGRIKSNEEMASCQRLEVHLPPCYIPNTGVFRRHSASLGTTKHLSSTSRTPGLHSSQVATPPHALIAIVSRAGLPSSS